MLMPLDKRDIFAYLQDAIRKRYDNPQNNIMTQIHCIRESSS